MFRNRILKSYPRAKLVYYVSKIRKMGFIPLLQWISRFVLSEIAWVFLLPFTLVGHVLGYRRVPVLVARIGHLASEVDVFLKDRAMGHLKQKRWFLLAPPDQVSNPALLEYWKDQLPILTGPWKCAILSSMSKHGIMSQNIKHYVLALQGTASAYSIQAAWGNRPPILTLKPEHRKFGQRILSDLGLPAEAWFVAIHARDAGFSPIDESAHSYRNSSIDRLIPSIQEIQKRGGWAIRMGDPSMGKLAPIAGLIDYANHSLRSDLMDLFLCAECRFFLGNSSGLFLMSTVFGIPCALANMVPTSVLGFSGKDISIPKLIWSQEQERYLSFPEIFTSRISNYRLSKLFEYAALIPEENTAEDILDLTREMLDRLEGRWQENREDNALQSDFKKLIQPGHYGYGAASRIGSAFLRRYESLLR